MQQNIWAFGKKGTNRLTECRVATNLQFVKKKGKKEKKKERKQKQYLQSTFKWSTIKRGMPVLIQPTLMVWQDKENQLDVDLNSGSASK